MKRLISIFRRGPNKKRAEREFTTAFHAYRKRVLAGDTRGQNYTRKELMRANAALLAADLGREWSN